MGGELPEQRSFRRTWAGKGRSKGRQKFHATATIRGGFNYVGETRTSLENPLTHKTRLWARGVEEKTQCTSKGAHCGKEASFSGIRIGEEGKCG